MTCQCGFCESNPPRACECDPDVLCEVDGAWKRLCLYCAREHEHIDRVIRIDDVPGVVEKALVTGDDINDEVWQMLVVPHLRGFRSVCE